MARAQRRETIKCIAIGGVTTALLTTSVWSYAAAAPTNVFISEYVEGTSYNKAIELYNGTGVSIDLAAGGYKIEIYTDGSPTATFTANLNGTIADGDVFVIGNGRAAQEIVNQTDQTFGLNFTGNDAVVLRKGTTIIDSIGQVGVDPGIEWGADNTSTADNTLRRKPNIMAGDTNPNDPFDPSIEWNGYPTNTFDGLGAHTITSTPEATATATATLEPSATFTATTEPTATSTPTAFPTNTPEPTLTPTNEPTSTLEPTVTATDEPTPTATPTNEPTPTNTPESTALPTDEPTPTATLLPTATSTPGSTITPTEEVTVTPTDEPTAPPIEDPTATNTPVPTVMPTDEPTPTNTTEPTVTATLEPTATEEPTATSTPLPPTATPVPPTATPLPTATPAPFEYRIFAPSVTQPR